MEWQFNMIGKPLGSTTEGPVWDGEVLRYTHIPANRIMQFDPRSGATTVWREDTNRTNGLAYNAKGQLFGCCSGGRSFLRFVADGSTTVIADRWESKRLNMPNDLVADHQGRIWFSNPWSARHAKPDEPQEIEHQSVMRADPQPDGSYNLVRATFDTVRPNGVLLSADSRTLYVADGGLASDGNRELRAYPIGDDGTLGDFALLHTFGRDGNGAHSGIDGMCLDADGNIVACAGWEMAGPGALIYVFSPRGRVIETQRLPIAHHTNCCFGGPDMRTLFVTGIDGHLLAAKTDRRGWALYP